MFRGAVRLFRSTHLPVELLEISVDALLAERDAALRGEISGDPRPPGDAAVQRDQARHLALEPPHALRKGVAQALDDLEQRKVDVAEPAAEDIGAAALAEHALEVAQEFRHPIAPEIP